MARRAISYDALTREVDSLRDQRDRYMIALQCAVSEKPDAVEWVKEPGYGWYTLRLYRSTGAMAGVVTMTYTANSMTQRPSTDVHWLDSLAASSGLADFLKDAVRALVAVRNRKLNEAK